MNLKNENIEKVLLLIAVHAHEITCIECCKYYTVPSTAICGHSLCHSCWRSRSICPSCGYNVDRRTLMLNLPLQSHTGNVKNFIKTLEEVLNIKYDNIINLPVEEDPNKNVKTWLTSSENNFSAPVTEYQEFLPQHQDSLFSLDPDHIQSVNPINIQIHSEKKKITTPKNVIHVAPQQDDWDKIEEMPEIETNCNKLKDNSNVSLYSFGFLNDENHSPATNHIDDSRISEKKNAKENSSIPNGNFRNNSNKNKITKEVVDSNRINKEFTKLAEKYGDKNGSIEKCKNPQTVKLFEVEDGIPTKEHNIDLDINHKNPIRNEIRDEYDVEIVLTPLNISHKKEIIKGNNTRKNISILQNSEKENFISDKLNKNHVNTKETYKDKEANVSFFQKGPLNIYNSNTVKSSEAYLKEMSNSNIISNDDDIEITIKTGTTLTNICIKKKENDIKLKITSDKEIQTCLNDISIVKKATSCSLDLCNNIINIKNNIPSNEKNLHNKDNIKITSSLPQVIEKSTPSKKNTASADTSTIQHEITETIEQELANSQNVFGTHPIRTQTVSQLLNKPNELKNSESLVKNKTLSNITENEESINIFDSEPIDAMNVQSLKHTKKTPSAILSLNTNTLKSQRDKRNRDCTEVKGLPINKKRKLLEKKEICSNSESSLIPELQKNKTTNNQVTVMETDSESLNYETSNKFLHDDADMEILTSTPNLVNTEIKQIDSSQNNVILSKKRAANDKYSENVFSLSKGSQDSEVLMTANFKTNFDENTKTQTKKPNEELEITKKLNKVNEEYKQVSSGENDSEVIEISTPVHDDDSDKSVVEDTPQKVHSFTVNKNSIYTENTQQSTTKVSKPIRNINANNGSNIVSLSDTIEESTIRNENMTVIETNRVTLDTPLTITQFAGHITHKSTPVARKSLNFNNMKEDDPEQTPGPSSFAAAKTTQEKEFLSKAFDSTFYSLSQVAKKTEKFCLAGSCLTGPEQVKLKYLCSQQNWTYVDKYSKEVTHLVVGVDEENRSQRSVKYMCALAGAKWIISYDWVEKCLQTKSIVDEEAFEALDGTGEPGPRRSRLAARRLFEGITFYCMPPFSVLDIDTLKDILRSAGGRVAAAAAGARATGARPALLLAEPENTQQDKFIYLAMKLDVVPVNYEWVLNCLGSYTLSSIHELLLCSATLLPKATKTWPSELMSRDFQ